MLKNLVNSLRSKRPEPTVWHGSHADIWGDPDARGYGWYCGQCGRNASQCPYPADAESAASKHAATHSGVNVEQWT